VIRRRALFCVLCVLLRFHAVGRSASGGNNPKIFLSADLSSQRHDYADYTDYFFVFSLTNLRPSVSSCLWLDKSADNHSGLLCHPIFLPLLPQLAVVSALSQNGITKILGLTLHPPTQHPIMKEGIRKSICSCLRSSLVMAYSLLDIGLRAVAALETEFTSPPWRGQGWVLKNGLWLMVNEKFFPLPGGARGGFLPSPLLLPCVAAAAKLELALRSRHGEAGWKGQGWVSYLPSQEGLGPPATLPARSRCAPGAAGGGVALPARSRCAPGAAGGRAGVGSYGMVDG
jgi:hypothetical protein